MKTISTLTLLLLALTLGSNANADTPTPLAKFAWLTGCWEGNVGASSFREHWMPEGGNMMMAMSRTLRDGKVTDYEMIRLELDADGVPVYVPKPSGQTEARFRLLSDTNKRFVFEDKQHDFPQRIIYQLNDDGSLLARIEGEVNSKARSRDFPMKRASCQ